ncbi:MAG TPA: ferric reductase-like transmembrane domain-containing protein [Planctomycetota bacterium]|nr:ferric reductase-like transmembrane domain-containing protein [Planctomycetota bacterium]
MLIDKSHAKWFAVTLLLAAGGAAYYFYYAHQMSQLGARPTGATLQGLSYGIAGFALMLFCGLLGARRAVRTWRLGRAQTWLKAHIWLGLLAFPLILFHSGMLFGNQLTLWLMILFIIVLVSGIVGVVLQNIIPGSMIEMVKLETSFEQIPYAINKLRVEAEDVTVGCCGLLPNSVPRAERNETEDEKEKRLKKLNVKLKTLTPDQLKQAVPLMNLYIEEVHAFLDPHYLHASHLASPQKARALFDRVKTLLPAELHGDLAKLQNLCEERRQMAVQARLHVWLHTWEYVHIPLSYLLLAMSFFHVIVATFNYSGFLNK